MVRLNRIYTRTGDDGSTGLVGGERVPKDDPRIEAYGTVDELNACIGLCRQAVGRLAIDVGIHETTVRRQRMQHDQRCDWCAINRQREFANEIEAIFGMQHDLLALAWQFNRGTNLDDLTQSNFPWKDFQQAP